MLQKSRRADGVHDTQRASYLGLSIAKNPRYLASQDIPFVELTDEQIAETIADLIAAEKVIGWFYGRMEFGPRASKAAPAAFADRTFFFSSLVSSRQSFLATGT